MYQDDSIAMLQRRGLIVLTCHTAVEEQARGSVEQWLRAGGHERGGESPTTSSRI